MGCCSSTPFTEESNKNQIMETKILKDDDVLPERVLDMKKEHTNEKDLMDEFEEEEINDNDNNDLLNKKIYILSKNLEAKGIKPEKLIEKINNDLRKIEFNKNEVIKIVSNILVENLKPINKNNTEYINTTIKLIIDKFDKFETFSKFLTEKINSIDFSRINNENEKIIINYIVNNLYQNEKIKNKKEEIIKKYKKNNYIINFDDLIKIVNEYNIIMEDLAFEYLIYKMKVGLSLDGKALFDNLNLKFFIDLLDKKVVEKESQKIKEIKDIIPLDKTKILFKNIYTFS